MCLKTASRLPDIVGSDQTVFVICCRVRGGEGQNIYFSACYMYFCSLFYIFSNNNNNNYNNNKRIIFVIQTMTSVFCRVHSLKLQRWFIN